MKQNFEHKIVRLVSNCLTNNLKLGNDSPSWFTFYTSKKLRAVCLCVCASEIRSVTVSNNFRLNCVEEKQIVFAHVIL
jgi:hypothetical protein